MSTALGISLLVLALGDSLNPSIILMTLYLLSTPQPLKRTFTYISGVYLTNWLLGLFAFFGFGSLLSSLLTRVVNSTSWWLYLLELLAAIALIVISLTMKTDDKNEIKKKPENLSPSATFTLGMGLTFVEFSTAAPYLAAISVLSKAQLSSVVSALALALYNIVYIAIPLIIIGSYLFGREQAQPFLEKLNQNLSGWVKRTGRVVFLVLGLILLADFVAYLLGAPFLVSQKP